ncbi:MAG TPA: HAD hydrolase-like protein, partial [Syntrophorhabdaceae bacterium]|nr:HAD hydrolase-like protein [Syntrophorhabdaceae bacterium]
MVKIKVGDHLIEDIEVAIFDKDGTIIELYHYWSKMVYFRSLFLCERLSLDKSHVKGLAYAMGVDFDKGRLRPEGPVGLKKREIVMGEAIKYLKNIGLNNIENACIDVFKYVDAFSQQNLKEFIKPIEGAMELLKNLFFNGCKIAIATTDISERAKIAMKYLDMEKYIHFFAGAEMVERPKPFPDQVELILNVLNSKRENAIMVGDAITDVQMGVNGGLKAS